MLKSCERQLVGFILVSSQLLLHSVPIPLSLKLKLHTMTLLTRSGIVGNHKFVRLCDRTGQIRKHAIRSKLSDECTLIHSGNIIGTCATCQVDRLRRRRTVTGKAYTEARKSIYLDSR